MKSIPPNVRSGSAVLIASVSIGLVPLSHGESAARPPMREAPTNEQLVLRLRQAEQQNSTKIENPSSAQDPSVTNRPQDLISRSEILCYNGILTLVPKRSVIQFPKNLADRLKPQPGAQIKTWADFYAANRGWITTIEVSLIQAQGKQPLSKETSTQMVKSGNLIVATFRGNPISVLPLEVPELPATANNSQKSEL
ncbi:MAG: hypothetical protein V4584_05130 [Verrucomicrobiota bacterium]